MAVTVEALLSVLTLEPAGSDRFLGQNLERERPRIFGGQVVAQALAATQLTVSPERTVHSLHSYFLRPGRPSLPVLYEVERIRDGKSFTTRRVVARQEEEVIFSMAASFQVNEGGLSHELPMPNVPQPEDLPTPADLDRRFKGVIPDRVRFAWQRDRPVEMRVANVEDYATRGMAEPRLYIWLRAKGKMPDDLALHQAVLAYASDFSLLDTSLLAHGRFSFSEGMQMASLDHAMWFHRPFRADDWLLFSNFSPSASNARGFSIGQIFSRDGRLVASAAQEGLVRTDVRPRSS